MDQARLLIAIVLSLLVFLVWHFVFNPQQQPQRAAKKVEAPAAEKEQPVQEKEKPYIAETEKIAPLAETTATPATPEIARTITVDTPLYEAKISENGAAFYSLLLKNYRESVARDAARKQILTGEEKLGIGQIGFAGQSIPGLAEGIFTADLASDELQVTDSSRDITFAWRTDDGILVQKTYTFIPDSYIVGMAVTVNNGSSRVLQDKLFVTLNSNAPSDKRLYAFEGPSAYINNHLEEIKTKKIKDQNTFEGKIKWVALQSRYFMSGIIPNQIEDASLRLALISDQ
ncbi:MAG: membrane protein insertase YidC, partial [Desulfobacterales bacterium]